MAAKLQVTTKTTRGVVKLIKSDSKATVVKSKVREVRRVIIEALLARKGSPIIRLVEKLNH